MENTQCPLVLTPRTPAQNAHHAVSRKDHDFPRASSAQSTALRADVRRERRSMIDVIIRYPDYLPSANMEVHRPLKKTNFPLGKGLFALPCLLVGGYSPTQSSAKAETQPVDPMFPTLLFVGPLCFSSQKLRKPYADLPCPKAAPVVIKCAGAGDI